jgi:hypothetical protein
MTTEPLREHLEWHLRRLKSARAAAAERSLQAESDGLQWLSLTHIAVLALEATLAEEVAPDHRALEEVIADLAGTSTHRELAMAASPAHTTPDPAENWTTAVASFSALAFPWRPPATAPRPFATAPEQPSDSGAAPFAAP